MAKSVARNIEHSEAYSTPREDAEVVGREENQLFHFLTYLLFTSFSASTNQIKLHEVKIISSRSLADTLAGSAVWDFRGLFYGMLREQRKEK